MHQQLLHVIDRFFERMEFCVYQQMRKVDNLVHKDLTNQISTILSSPDRRRTANKTTVSVRNSQSAWADFFKNTSFLNLSSKKKKKKHVKYIQEYNYNRSWKVEEARFGLRLDLKGQQLFRMHVVERPQLGKLQEEFGEDGRFVRVVLHDQVPQSSDQSLLQGLHGAHVLDGRSVCAGKRQRVKKQVWSVQNGFVVNGELRLPADTRTTAVKRLVSSSLSWRAVSFSLNSNMHVRSSPVPRERSRSTLYFLPPRKLTVRSFTSNSDTKRTINTWK